MGRVTVAAKIENLHDVENVQLGLLDADRVRHVEVPNALIDTGAVRLSLPRRLIEQLGIQGFREQQFRTSAGVITAGVYSAVRLTVQGRDCIVDVTELPDDCPVLVGQVPLELLDFVVDPLNRRLVGNPEHGGEHMIDLF